MQRAPLPPLLTTALERLQAVDGTTVDISADELMQWPADVVNGLRRQRVLVRGEPASTVRCTGCEYGCMMPVDVRTGPDGKSTAMVVCDRRDDIGRVPVPLDALAQSRITLASLAQAFAPQLGTAAPTPLAAGYRLGWLDTGHGREAVLLMRDGPGLAVSVAGNSTELAAVMLWNASTLSLDLPALRRRAESPANGLDPAREDSDARAARLLARKRALMGAGNRRFIKVIVEEEEISETRVKELIRQAEVQEKATVSPLSAMAGVLAKKGGTSIPEKPQGKSRR